MRYYYAMAELVSEGQMDFCGIKGTPELTNNFTTAAIAEPILDGPCLLHRLLRRSFRKDGPTLPVTQEVALLVRRGGGAVLAASSEATLARRPPYDALYGPQPASTSMTRPRTTP